MGDFEDKSGKGFQNNWDWPHRTHVVTEPPRLPNVVGKFVLVGSVALGIFAYLAAHGWFGGK
jgi:hypothetical protein